MLKRVDYVGFSSRDGAAAIFAQIDYGLRCGVWRLHCAMATDVPMPTKALTTKPAPIIDIWTFSATPYAWATMMNGSVTVKGRTADINVDL